MKTKLLLGIILFFHCVCFAQKLPQPFFLDYVRNLNGHDERTICGSNDMVPMTSSSENLNSMGTPIGIYSGEVDGGIGFCTGTLITKDLFLTAEHCAAECESIKVTFGYLGREREETFNCKKIIEKGDGKAENDYLIVQLEGSPGVQWGWYDVSASPVESDSQLLMIHHPKATPMKVSYKNCSLKSEEGSFLMHQCDTQSGSSGSAILLPNFETPEETKIVGVHTLGGCDEEAESANSGPSMRHLVEISPTLRSIAK